MHYFSNKFSKIAKCWGQIWPNCVFSNWLWQNRTFKKSVMVSVQWCHRYYVTKNVIRFSILGLSQSKFLVTSVYANYI